MSPSDRAPSTARPEPWGEGDRKIAERPAEGEWLGADEPERFGDQMRDQLERARLAAAFLDSPVFLAVTLGPEHVLHNANPACYRLAGPRRLLGEKVRDAVPELGEGDCLDLLDRVYESGEPAVSPERTLALARGPDRPSARVHVSTSLHPLVEEDGSTRGLLVLGIDLTERWRERRESERFLGTLTSNLPGVLYRCRNDESWTMTYVSEGCRALTGYRPEELEDSREAVYGELIHPGDRQEVWDEVQEAVAEDRPFQLVYRIRTREGEEKWVWEQGRAVDPALPHGGSLEGVVFDVTDWKAARDEAERSHGLLQATFNSLEDAVFVIGTDGRTIEACNPAAERLFGWDREELEGSSTEKLHVDREHYERFGRESEAVLAEEGVYRGEFRMRRKDGSTFVTEHVVSYVAGDAEPRRAVSVVRDVSERREREEEVRRSRDLLQAVVESTSDGIFVKDRSGEILFANSAASRLLAGSADAELAGRREEELLDSETLEMVRRVDGEVYASGEVARSEQTIRVEDGGVRTFDVLVAPFRRANGETAGVVGVARDITERKEAEEKLRRAESKYSKVFQVTPITLSIATLDEGRLLEINEGFEELYGWSREEAVGRRGRELELWPHPEMRERLVERLQEAGSLRNVEVSLRARSGDPVDVLFSAELLELEGEPCMLAATQDITDRKAAERELERLALRDGLTDLPNRSLFRDRLGHALERCRRAGTSVAVLFLDLDRFKVVNDTLGHPAGDALLQEAARRIRSCFRDEDTVARLGGDEFAGLLEDIDSEEDARRVADRLVEVFDPPFEVAGTEVHAEASIGIAMSDHGAERPDDLLRFSDVAMYRVKEREGTRYHVFDPEEDRAETVRLHRENELRRAIGEGQFYLEFQPTVRLEDRRVIGAEALVRWDHPEQGRVSPDDFIPLAEETGLIVPLGEWVLEEACRTVQAWRREVLPPDDPFTLSVNLSGRQCQEEDLVERVLDVADRTGLPGRALQLEITESVLMTGRGRLQELREKGVRLAIDDFGTGYSSLQYLRRVQADALKVDRTFVADLETDPRDSIVVKAILLVARQIGIDVVAEGIETEAQRDHLEKLGCSVGQGFLFARPMPPDAFARLLREQRSDG